MLFTGCVAFKSIYKKEGDSLSPRGKNNNWTLKPAGNMEDWLLKETACSSSFTDEQLNGELVPSL